MGETVSSKRFYSREELPQIIEMEAVGAIDVLLLKRSLTPTSAASGQAPLSSARSTDAAFTSFVYMFKYFIIPDF